MEHKDRKYTKGDCYALCEFLDALTLYNADIITDIAKELGYTGERMRELLICLSCDIDGIIGDEQDENNYTEQMAEIMELKHIKGAENE